jgi:hypothetical protein
MPHSFCLVYFSDGVSCFYLRQPWTMILLPLPSVYLVLQVWTISLLVLWDRPLLTFCLGWPPSVILLIFSSQVSRSIGISNHKQPYKQPILIGTNQGPMRTTSVPFSMIPQWSNHQTLGSITSQHFHTENQSANTWTLVGYLQTILKL